MLLTLLIPYRKRLAHLKTFVRWFADDPSYRGRVEAVLLETDGAPGEARELAREAGLRYDFVECAGVFHKTLALNRGLSLAGGRLVTSFDIDLVPIDDALNRQVRAALESPALLFTAYRLLSRRAQVAPADVSGAASKARISSEDGRSALRKYLVNGERFGHVPLFETETLRRLGGWDESFVGWGAEDQEVIERYVSATGKVFVRAPGFTYLHLFHKHAALWNEPELTAENRKRHRLRRVELARPGAAAAHVAVKGKPA
jgi:hypothetical protein